MGTKPKARCPERTGFQNKIKIWDPHSGQELRSLNLHTAAVHIACWNPMDDAVLTVADVAKWTHNGEKGSLLFPCSWLNEEATEFYGREVHVVAPELQYVLKENPELLNPDWMVREKDIFDKEYLRDILLKRKIDICSLHELVSSM